jgi:hypothetical protein
MNSHAKMSMYYLAINSIGSFFSYLIAIYLGIQGFIYSLILVELITVVVILPMALNVSKDSLRNFISSILDILVNVFGCRSK